MGVMVCHRATPAQSECPCCRRFPPEQATPARNKRQLHPRPPACVAIGQIHQRGIAPLPAHGHGQSSARRVYHRPVQITPGRSSSRMVSLPVSTSPAPPVCRPGGKQRTCHRRSNKVPRRVPPLIFLCGFASPAPRYPIPPDCETIPTPDANARTPPVCPWGNFGRAVGEGTTRQARQLPRRPIKPHQVVLTTWWSSTPQSRGYCPRHDPSRRFRGGPCSTVRPWLAVRRDPRAYPRALSMPSHQAQQSPDI